MIFVYSFLECKYCATQGKWLLGIRVVGTDLNPCGFGRAFLRNILRFVNGFLNYLVGILIISFTENQQRVGNMAARTIVIKNRMLTEKNQLPITDYLNFDKLNGRSSGAGIRITGLPSSRDFCSAKFAFAVFIIYFTD